MVVTTRRDRNTEAVTESVCDCRVETTTFDAIQRLLVLALHIIYQGGRIGT